ncbi:MAG: methyltransferase [Omnitrophica bacterium GWA2_52_8]|nr:MAG: methyltransferase [Omnitrophica bacterium GWA2_52_8]
MKSGPESHWNSVYRMKTPEQVSWFQPRLEKSLELIAISGVDKKERILDAGGGASTLAGDLLTRGYENITVLDISGQALQKAKDRLGKTADNMTWIEANITKVDLLEDSIALWHDRAVFHFLTAEKDRWAYAKTLNKALKPGGYLILACFSLEGPSKCSGLEVMRYSPETLSRELGPGFSLVQSDFENHKTPFGTQQNFVYCLFRKR